MALVVDAFTGVSGRAKRGTGKAGFLRFKTKSRWRSFGLQQIAGLQLDLQHHRIRLKGMDHAIWIYPDRKLPEDAKLLGATFTKGGRAWFLALAFDSASIVASEHAQPGSIVGCDLGLAALITLFTGERIENRRPEPTSANMAWFWTAILPRRCSCISGLSARDTALGTQASGLPHSCPEKPAASAGRVVTSEAGLDI